MREKDKFYDHMILYTLDFLEEAAIILDALDEDGYEFPSLERIQKSTEDAITYVHEALYK